MSGVVAYLLAGAGPSTSRRAVRYHRDCVRATGKARPRIAYVGAAANDNRAFAAMLRALVFGAGADVELVSLGRKATATSTLRHKLADADLVFFTGGDVERGMQLIEQRGLGPYLRELALQGKPMEGISAGSILLGRSWVRFPDGDEARAERFACLGIVPCSFDTHGEGDGWEELLQLARLLAHDPAEREVYGIPSGGCARWQGGALAALGEPLARFACADPPVALAPLACA
ncbi:MAG: Type 1 glutamine amidotransferase-like domain-containing protein [Polyangiaceae bacterium]|nr:Type 1 glutamine amidotransferase-like domain-containing protein [Polyangiaceae bacterium]